MNPTNEKAAAEVGDDQAMKGSQAPQEAQSDPVQDQPSRSNILDAITSRLQAESELTKVKDEERRQQERKGKVLRATHDLTFTLSYSQASPCLKVSLSLLAHSDTRL